MFGLLALAAGCEPEGIGGVDRDRPLVALSASESADLCAALDERFDEAAQDPTIRRGVCVYTAHLLAELDADESGGDERALCEQHLTECLEQPKPPMLGFECGRAFPLCQSRVGELDACTWLALEEFRAAGGGDCSAKVESRQSTPPGWPSYQDCSRLHALCFPRLDD